MSDHTIKNKRFMAYTASAMYAAGALDGAVEGFLPHDPPFALVPVIAASAIFLFLVTVGRRLPWICLAMLGPIGVAAIAYAVATTPGAGDGAVLYTMPVLWTTTSGVMKPAIGCLSGWRGADCRVARDRHRRPGRRRGVRDVSARH